MIALAFDTSTTVLSIALENGNKFYEATRIVGLSHSEKLLTLIDTLFYESGLKPNQLDVVICTKGPGSFTGLRIGMATAKGIAAGASCDLISVSTLDVLALHPFMEYVTVVPVIDAKKNNYYTALYQHSGRITDYLDISGKELVELISTHTPALITGPAASHFSDAADGRRISVDTRTASGTGFPLLQLGVELWRKGERDSKSEGPLYIRKSDAELMFGKKRDGRQQI
jgi:tRNA threonylcarbamoyladenosine biosynthesis protein TsaB